MQKQRRSIRYISLVLIAVFMNFMFMNSAFMHLHTLPDGTKITHSHPYIPSAQHSHSGNSLSLISSFNSAAFSFQGVNPFMLTVFATALPSLLLCLPSFIESGVKDSCSLRAPPVLI